jgi:phosphoribosyl-ATP pyrophosphohydrolase/phosphoribosyl-AMP cyclohydrolase
MIDANDLDFGKYADGLVPAVVQDSRTARVLMVGFMDEEALRRTVSTGFVTFFSRSRRKLWTKGETSGNFLKVRGIVADCDRDTLLVSAEPAGPVCHTGADTCFGERNARQILFELERVIAERKGDPDPASYTSRLFAAGLNKIAQKVGEEAVELLIESKDDDRTLFVNEAADLIFHLLVLFAEKDVALDDVFDALAARRR